MPKRKNIPKDEDRCICIKKDHVRCDMPKADGQSFCLAYHSDLNEYTQEQIDSIKRCAKCKNYRAFDPGERYCIHCTAKLGPNKIKPKKTASKSQARCKGMTRTGDQCGQKSMVGSDYCTYHKHWDDYSETDLQNIKQCRRVRCSKYDLLNNDNLCSKCATEKNKKATKKSKAKKTRKIKIYKCKGYSEDKSRCRFKVLQNESFCRYHIDMKHYTEDMLNIDNQSKCTKCLRPRWRYFPNTDRCEDCQKKDKSKPKCRGLTTEGKPCGLYQKYGEFCHYHMDMNGDKEKGIPKYTEEMLNNLEYCKGNRHFRYCGPGYKTCIHCRSVGKENRQKAAAERAELPKCLLCDHPQTFGKYCGDHKLQDYVEKVRSSGKEPCANYNRGACRETLSPDYPYTKCEECLEADRIKNRDRYAAKQENIKKQREELNYEVSMCLGCNVVHSMHMFVVSGQSDYSYYCNHCRAYDRANVNMYTRRNTWTDKTKYKDYIKVAKRRSKEWNLKEEEFLKIIRNPCLYCGVVETKVNDNGIVYNCNGIDRYNNEFGYVPNNCVSCCPMCNFMKYTHSKEDFINYCQNIYDNYGACKQSKCELYHKSYSAYKYDAKRRGKSFEITKRQFLDILKNVCYYCANNNGTDQIGVDRYDSEIGYSDADNKLVACCKICNTMKKDYHADEFYNKILDILLHNERITEDEYNEARKSTEPKTDLARLVRRIKETLSYEDEKDPDRRNIYKFRYDHTYYVHKIWESMDVTQLKPEIIFCETDDQHDIWMYYRLIISSHSVNSAKDTVGRNIRVLVRDKFTQKYIGIAELSSTVYSCGPLDDEIGWTTKAKKSRINNVMNISICVALPPFSHNFNGGKLITKLMFSKEVLDYFQQKYNTHLGGIITYSLHGESVQYSDLSELKYLGLTSGYSLTNCKMSRGIINKVCKYLAKWGKKVSKNNLHNISNFCEHLNIRDVTEHTKRRGVYFGYTTPDSQEYLQRCSNMNSDCSEITDESSDDQINTSEIKSVDTLSNEWIIIALDRFQELLKQSTDIESNRGLRFKINYNYDQYYVDNKGKDRHRKKTTEYDRKNSDYLSRVKILNDWFANWDQTYVSLAEKYDTTTKRVRMILMGKSVVTGDNKRIANDLSANRLRNYEKLKKTKFVSCDKILIDLESSRRNVFRLQNNRFNFVIAKSNLNILQYRRNNDKNMFVKFKEIDNIEKGDWRINKRTFNDNNTLIDIQSETYQKKNKHIRRIARHSRDFHQITGLALFQSNIDSVRVDDINAYSNPFKITSKNNLFFSLIDTVVMDIKIIQYYRTDDDDQKICRVTIELDEPDEPIDDIDIELDDISVDPSCDDSDCFCRFKGVQIIKNAQKINVKGKSSKKNIVKVRKATR